MFDITKFKQVLSSFKIIFDILRLLCALRDAAQMKVSPLPAASFPMIIVAVRALHGQSTENFVMIPAQRIFFDATFATDLCILGAFQIFETICF